MLDRIEGVFRKLSNFSADIAHDMHTPITNLMTQTGVALSPVRSVEHYREVLYSNLEEYERMAKMVSDTLFLAQADNKLLKPEIVNVDLATEVLSLVGDKWMLRVENPASAISPQLITFKMTLPT